MRSILNALREFGIDPLKLLTGLKGLGRYISNLIMFIIKSRNLRNFRIEPVVCDFRTTSGSGDGRYFWQDLICAQWISQSKPQEHVDIGSRVDGFIGHLLCFMDVTVIDIRPLDPPT